MIPPSSSLPCTSPSLPHSNYSQTPQGCIIMFTLGSRDEGKQETNMALGLDAKIDNFLWLLFISFEQD